MRLQFKNKVSKNLTVSFNKDTVMSYNSDMSWLNKKVNVSLLSELVGKHEDLTSGIEDSVNKLKELKQRIGDELTIRSAQDRILEFKKTATVVGTSVATPLILVALRVAGYLRWRCMRKRGRRTGKTEVVVNLGSKHREESVKKAVSKISPKERVSYDDEEIEHRERRGREANYKRSIKKMEPPPKPPVHQVSRHVDSGVFSMQ